MSPIVGYIAMSLSATYHCTAAGRSNRGHHAFWKTQRQRTHDRAGDSRPVGSSDADHAVDFATREPSAHDFDTGRDHGPGSVRARETSEIGPSQSRGFRDFPGANVGEVMAVRTQRQVHQPRRGTGRGQRVANKTRCLMLAVQRSENGYTNRLH
jgi:hypothetical protein